MFDFNSMSAFLYVELDIFSMLLLVVLCLFSYWLFKRQGWTRPVPAIATAGLYLVAFFLDGVEAMAEYFDALSATSLYVINSLYFVAIVAAATAYLIYVYVRLGFARKDKGSEIMLLCIPSTIVGIMSITAISNGMLFYMSDANHYTRGPIYHAYTGAIIFYYGLGIILSSYAYFREKKRTGKKRTDDTYLMTGLVLYACFNLLCFLVQWITQFNFYPMGATISVCIFVIIMIYGQVNKSSQFMAKQDLKIAEMNEILKEEREVKEFFLTGYFAAFYVDLDSHTYKVYFCDDDKYKGSEDFFELAAKICEDFVAGEDGTNILSLLKPEAIRRILKEEKQFQVIVRSSNRDGQHYILMHIVRGADENHVAIGFTDVDNLVKRRMEEARRIDQSHHLIEMLGGMVESRNMESGEHIQRVKEYTKILAESMMKKYPEYGLDMHKIELIVSASALHDVGKIKISDSILLKPGKLTPEEFEAMKEHTIIGSAIVSKMMIGLDEEYARYCREIALYHHEKCDGKGYPEGLKGDQIPISAQLVSIADCFDALTTKRVYKDAYSLDEAYDMILGGKCGQFSGKILDCFIAKREELFEKAEELKA